MYKKILPNKLWRLSWIKLLKKNYRKFFKKCVLKFYKEKSYKTL